MDDEILDLVTRDDKVIGTINRIDHYKLLASASGYIRSCDLFIVNSRNQIYVPVRTPHKTIAPNGYDFSVGGHVGAGESYEEALIREAQEELNITLAKDELKFITKTAHEDIRYIQSLFVYHTNVTPTFNPNDFVKAEWLSSEEFLKRLNSGHPAKGSLKYSLQLLNEHLASH